MARVRRGGGGQRRGHYRGGKKNSECEGRRSEGMRVLGLAGGWDSKFEELNETIGVEPGTRRESYTKPMDQCVRGFPPGII